MSDPFSIGAGVVGVFSLGIEVSKILDRFINDWRNVPAEVEGFKRELERHQAALERTEQFIKWNSANHQSADRNSSQHSFFASTSNAADFESCRKELLGLRDALNIPSKTHLRNGWLRIKNAIQVKSLRESIEKVDRICGQINFNVSLEVSLENLGTSMAVTEGITEIQTALSNRFQHEDKSKIMSWISRMNFKERHETLAQEHHEGTGEWLLAREDFQVWRNNVSQNWEGNEVPPILWCHGIPGAGKSVMTSFVIEHLKNLFNTNPKPAVVYVYCDYKERKRQTADNLMLTLVKQAILQLEESESMPREVIDAYVEHAHGETHMSRTEVRHLLITLLKRFRRSFLVIDALDEYVHSRGDAFSLRYVEIFDELLEVMSGCHGSCRIFVTSRENCLDHYKSVPAKRVEILAADEDIRRYVDSFIHSDRFSHADSVSKNPELAEDITESLAKNACGQFLLPALHLQLLTLQPSIRDVREELLRLPTELYDVYAIAVRRIGEQSGRPKDLGMRILAWIIYAVRPLTVPELQHALATRTEDRRFDKEGILAANEFIARTAGLLRIQNGKIQCVHHTVEEFLKQPEKENDYFPVAKKNIALICVTYMRFEDFNHLTDDMQKRNLDFPFLNYAAMNWGYHATKCLEHEPALYQTFADVLDRDRIPLGSLQVIAAKVLQNPQPQRIPLWKTNLRQLHLAIVCGLDTMVEMMLSREDVNVEELGFKEETALHMAARSSSKRVTDLLLKHKAKVNATNYSGKSALDMMMIAPWQLVSQKVDEPNFIKQLVATLFVRLFVDTATSSPRELSEIDKKLQGSLTDKNPLQRMRENSQFHTQMILARDYKMDISDQDEEIAYSLLDAGIDVNSQHAPNATALQLAAMYGRTNLVRVLLEKGANPFLERKLGWNALKLAEHCKHNDIVDLLTKKMEIIETLERESPNDDDKLAVPGQFQAKYLEEQARLQENKRLSRMFDYKSEGGPALSPANIVAILRLKFSPGQNELHSENYTCGTAAAHLPRSDAPESQQTVNVSTSGDKTGPVAPPSSDPASNPEPSSVTTTDRGTDPASNPEPSSVTTTDRGTDPASPIASCAPTMIPSPKL